MDTHYLVKLHFQEPDEPSVLLMINLMELQNTIDRITREFEFLHSLLDGVVFRLALLLGTFREVEVELGVEYLPMLLLGWNVVPIHLRTNSDACHAVLLLNLFRCVPLGLV